MSPTEEADPRPAAPRAIEARGLVKRYGRADALRGLDLTVREGEVYGFLGRNGAGKTTAIRILLGITRAKRGEVRLFGEPVQGDAIRLRRRIGYVAQEQNFYGWMTPLSIGRFVGGLYPSWDGGEYDRLLGALDLPPRRKIRELSGGMRAKLALALALAHRPRLLVLDEPTAGLDPVARREFLEMVREQADRTGRTTFFSSHILAEVERVADRVGIVEEGRMLYEGALADLAATTRRLSHAALGNLSQPPLPPALSDPAGGFEILRDRLRGGEREVVLSARSPDLFERILADSDGWSIEPLSLEDIFIEMVRKRAA